MSEDGLGYCFAGGDLSSAETPAGCHEYLLPLLQIRQNPKVRRLARKREGDREPAGDALQRTFEAVARAKDPDAIEDLRAYFCQVLIRALNALRGQLGAVPADDFAFIADACLVGVGGMPPRPVDEVVTRFLLVRGRCGRPPTKDLLSVSPDFHIRHHRVRLCSGSRESSTHRRMAKRLVPVLSGRLVYRLTTGGRRDK